MKEVRRTDIGEILGEAKVENGGISLGTSDRKTWMSKSLQTSNSALFPRHIGLQLTIPATIPLINPVIGEYAMVHELAINPKTQPRYEHLRLFSAISLQGVK